MKKDNSRTIKQEELNNSDQVQIEFAMMDTDKNSLIETEVAKEPFKQDFSSINIDNDGFITKEELENIPKPKKPRPASIEKEEANNLAFSFL